MLPEKGSLLRVFIGEDDKFDGKPLYEWILQQAREHKLAGATVIRGIAGFGAKSHMHSAKLLRLSMDLPIIIEIVDTRENIERFLPVIDEAVNDGLATIENVEIRFYRAGNS